MTAAGGYNDVVISPTNSPHNENHQGQGLFGGVMLSGSSQHNGHEHNSARMPTEPSSPYLYPGFSMAQQERPLSANTGGQGGSYGEPALNIGHLQGGRLVRSQSAAPDTGFPLGPPPGLMGRANSDSYGSQRSASTGVLNDPKTALRPAAKTLMDLIQEDYPAESNRERQYGQDVQAVNRGSGSPSLATRQQLQQEQQQPTRDHARYDQVHYPSSPQNDLGPHSYARESMPALVRAQDPYERSRQQQQPVSIPRYDHVQEHPTQAASMYTGHSYGGQQQSHGGGGQGLAQQTHLRPGHMPQQQDHLHHLHGGPHSQQPILETQQQVYYGNQQRVDHMQQPGTLQAQVMSSGQTVFVNTSPPQQQGYGYTTLQYPHSQQQSQVIHQQPLSRNGSRGDEQQYLSVLPMQSGGGGVGQQMAYWQADGSSPGQGIGQTVTLMNAAPGGMSGGRGHGMDSRPQSGGAGRTRGETKANGRGRKGSGGRRGDAKNAVSSPSSHVLEEFRLTKNRDWTVRQIEGHVIEFCQDQNGSRFIQQRLEMGDVMEQQIVMGEVLPAIRLLRNDVFGNYVIQKLLDFGSPGVKADIRDTLKGEMLQLSLQMYGCRVVQKALEALDEQDIPALLAEFHHNVLSCIHDQNGNHVIQKCIEVMSIRARKGRQVGDQDRADTLSGQIDFIVSDVLANTATLSCHPYGCRVLQRILEHCDDERKTAALDKIALCHRKLLDDQYGNYVIQHVLQYGRDPDRDSILGIVLESGLLRLSRQKFASNVVEKLLKYGNGNQRSRIVEEMLKVSEPGCFWKLKPLSRIDCL